MTVPEIRAAKMAYPCANFAPLWLIVRYCYAYAEAAVKALAASGDASVNAFGRGYGA